MQALMRLFNRFSFRRKLMITYGIIALLCVLIVGGVFTSLARGILQAQALEQARSGVQSLQVRLRQIVSRVSDVSDELYLNRQLERIAATAYQSPQQAYDEYAAFDAFNRILHVSPEIRRITVYLDNDTLLENGQFMRLTEAVRGGDAYLEASAHQGAVVWRVEAAGGQSTLHLSRQLSGDERVGYGLLDIELSASYLHALVRSERFDTVLTVHGMPFAASAAFPTETLWPAAESGAEAAQAGERLNIGGIGYLHVREAFLVPFSAKWNAFGVSMLVPEAAIYESANALTQKGMLVCLIALGVSFVCLLLFSILFSRRIGLLRQEMHRVVDGDLEAYAIIDGDDEIAHLYEDLCLIRSSFKSLLDNIQTQQQTREALLVKQQQIELKLLSNQINPHFLFNTLETVRMRAHAAGVPGIAQAVKMLARMMRVKMSLREETVPLRQEVGMVRDYLDIQRFRYEDRVRYTLDVQEGLAEHPVLPLLIQPIVENAFLHGLDEKREGGCIHIAIDAQADTLRIRVCDNGLGMDVGTLRSLADSLHARDSAEDDHGIGLKNVQDRIRLYYGEAYGVAIASEAGAGTTVVLTLPYEGGVAC